MVVEGGSEGWCLLLGLGWPHRALVVTSAGICKAGVLHDNVAGLGNSGHLRGSEDAMKARAVAVTLAP